MIKTIINSILAIALIILMLPVKILTGIITIINPKMKDK